MVTFYGYKKGQEVQVTALRIPKHELKAVVGGIALFSSANDNSGTDWFYAQRDRPRDFDEARKLGSRPGLSRSRVHGEHILSYQDGPIDNRNADGVLIVDSLDGISKQLFG